MSDPFNDDEPHQPRIIGDGWKHRVGLRGREDVALQAMRQAMGVQDEINGLREGIGSQFRAYIEHTEQVALRALVLLAKVPFNDTAEVLRLQKEIQPWNSVMQWIDNVMEKGDRAADEIDAREHEDETGNEEDRIRNMAVRFAEQGAQ